VVDGNTDVWLVDTERATFRRLTLDPGIDGEPIISPDGSRLVYVADGRDDVYQMYERPADGTGGETLLLETNEHKNPRDWSPDGRYILFTNQSLETGWDLLALPLAGDRKPLEVARTRFDEANGRFSPDGRWVAYSSAESGRSEVYVQSFPGGEGKQVVSVGGGQFPRWRRDGRELYYFTPAGDRLMAVSVSTAATKFQAEAPLYLFTALARRYGFEPSLDGQKFLLNIQVSEPSPITVILNWKRPGR
jgi:Tol biopolymer transport system component